MQPPTDTAAGAWAAAAACAAALTALAPPAAASGCRLSGFAEIPRDTPLFDSAQAGEAIARFTGARIAAQTGEFPKAAHGRVQVAAGAGNGGFRLNGFIGVNALPIYTQQPLPVYPGHIWIAAARSIRVTAAAPGKLRVEKRVTTPIAQIFSAWAPCRALTLTPSVPYAWSPPGEARGYVVEQQRIDLFESPSGRVIAGITRGTGATPILTWSTENSGAWVHIEYHGDVVFDAWARAAELTPLPEGETLDQVTPVVGHRSAPRLKLAGAEVVRTIRPMPVLATASDRGRKVGQIDAGSEIYVTHTVAGWASVLPRAMNLLPPDGKHFWVKAADIGS